MSHLSVGVLNGHDSEDLWKTIRSTLLWEEDEDLATQVFGSVFQDYSGKLIHSAFEELRSALPSAVETILEKEELDPEEVDSAILHPLLHLFEDLKDLGLAHRSVLSLPET